MSDFFKRLKAEEYKALKPIENLVFVNGVAINSEDDLCIVCVSWFDRNFGRNKRFNLIHIPNEGRRTRWEALRLQRMGLRSGTPDYLLSKNGVPVCWLEFKFGKNGLTDFQKEFREFAKAAGFGFELIRSFDEFKAALMKYGVYSPQKIKEDRIFIENIFKDKGK